MADELDVDAMLAAVPRPRRRGAQPSIAADRGGGAHRFIRQAQLDYQDFAMIGDATAPSTTASSRCDRPAPADSDMATVRVAAIAAIDAANADDPETIVVRGERRRRSRRTPS